MTESPPIVPTEPVPDAGSAGAMLRAAREAAGLSIDALSQQLKLSPRQVKALAPSAPSSGSVAVPA